MNCNTLRTHTSAVKERVRVSVEYPDLNIVVGGAQSVFCAVAGHKGRGQWAETSCACGKSERVC